MLSILLGMMTQSWLLGRRIDLPSLAASSYADTEASTNLAFNQRVDLREVEIAVGLDGCPSNCVQVAFGTDDDADGVLDVDETETMLGIRCGRCFLEDFPRGVRYEEACPGDVAARTLVFSVAIAKDHSVESLVVTNVAGASLFQGLCASAPLWVYRPEWNIMRVTRRGPGVPAEWFVCDQRTRFLHMVVR